MKRKTIFGYKVRVRGRFKVGDDTYMILWESLLKCPTTPYEYLDVSFYFVRVKDEVVIRNSCSNEEFETIQWKEYMKYRIVKLDKDLVTNWYEENKEDFCNENRFGYTKEDVEHFKKKSFIKFSSFLPCSERFEKLFPDLQEGEKVPIHILGIEESIEVTEERYRFYKNLLENL